jgi:hypothetical protein
MAQTKADRRAAAQKAAATRKRNKIKAESKARGKKAGATRQGNAAAESLGQAKRTASGAVSGLGTAAKSVGKAAKQAGKSAATRAGVAEPKRQAKKR